MTNPSISSHFHPGGESKAVTKSSGGEEILVQAKLPIPESIVRRQSTMITRACLTRFIKALLCQYVAQTENCLEKRLFNDLNSDGGGTSFVQGFD